MSYLTIPDETVPSTSAQGAEREPTDAFDPPRDCTHGYGCCDHHGLCRGLGKCAATVSNAEIAERLRAGGPTRHEVADLAAQRLEARGISEAMVERAAEAMCNEAEHVKPPGTAWGLKSIERRAMYRCYARAALAAALSGEKDDAASD